MMNQSITLQLNQCEFDLLERQDPATKQDGGYQRLLVTLQEITNPKSNVMILPVPLIEKIRRYAFSYGNGGWEDRLTGIFGRHLGPRLDQVPED